MSASRVSRVSAGDFIYSRLFAWRGAFDVIDQNLDGCFVSNEFPTFACDEDHVDAHFLNYYFRLKPTLTKVEADCTGSTPQTRNRFKERFFLNLEIPLPPLPEQKRIVTKVQSLASKIDEARELQKQADTVRSALLDSFTDRLFQGLEECRDLAVRELGVDGDNPVQTGPFGAQLHKSEFVEKGTPVLNVGNVWPDGLKLDRLDHVMPDKAAQLSRYSLLPGDLLFARTGATLGKVCVVPEQCAGWLMTGHLFRVRFDRKRCLPEFAFAAFRSCRGVRDQVFDQVRGATRPGFNTSLLSRVELPLPPIARQRQLVASVGRLKTRIARLDACQRDRAHRVDALGPSILDRAFKGEL